MQEHLDTILSVLMLIGIIITVYRTFSDPDEKAASRIGVLEMIIEERKQATEKYIQTIQGEISIIKENHLRHIEADITEIKGDMKAILAVMKHDNERAK